MRSTSSEQPGSSPWSQTRPSATTHALQELRSRLSSGEWNAGERLPSEPELAALLGVSRGSIRQALAALAGEGLVTRRRGVGTFVNSVRPLVSSLHRNLGSDDLIRSDGRAPGISRISLRRTTANADIANSLSVPTGTEVAELYRVRTADGVPVTVEYDYFPAELLSGDTMSIGPSLYTFLSEDCGVDVAFGVADLVPSVVDDTLAEALDLAVGDPCLILRQVDYDVSEMPVSYTEEFHRADAFRFRLIRQGPFDPDAGPRDLSG